VREIAEELGVTSEGVRVALRRHGLWRHGGRRQAEQIAA
jgi:hypothetical protein